MRPTYSLCCVVDRHPRFHVELVLWAICVGRHLRHRARPVVYAVGGHLPSDLAGWLAGRNFEIRALTPPVPAAPHCNKIGPFLDHHETDFTVVCDTDLFFIADPGIYLRAPRFKAAPNNHALPPSRVFKSILEGCGLQRRYRPGLSLFAGPDGTRETHVNNVSAGIVAAPRHRTGELARTWRKWALWLIENRSLLEAWGVHVDQVGFALALEELAEDVEFFPPQVNAVLHLLTEISTGIGFHLTTGHIPAFPGRFNPDRTLVVDGLASGMADSINTLNACIGEAVDQIRSLASTRDHMDKFLNPGWQR